MRDQDDMEIAIADHYDRVAARYRHLDQDGELVLERLGDVPADEEILDIGCATGNLSFLIADAQPGRRVVGVDLSERALAIAREEAGRRGMDGFSFQRASMLALPFEDRRFGAVASNMVLHLIEDKRRALRETLRVLKPGGTAVLQFMSGEVIVPEWQALLADAWREVVSDEPPPVVYYGVTSQDLDELLLELGVGWSEVLHRRVVRRLEQEGVESFLGFNGLVGGHWRYGLDENAVVRIRTGMRRRLDAYFESESVFSVTIERSILTLRRSAT